MLNHNTLTLTESASASQNMEKSFEALLRPQRSEQAIQNYICSHDLNPAGLAAEFTESGMLSEASKNKLISVVNFYRWISGLKPVSENPELSEYASELARIDSSENSNLLLSPSSFLTSTSENPFSELISYFTASVSSENKSLRNRRMLLLEGLEEIGAAYCQKTNRLVLYLGKENRYARQKIVVFPPAGSIPSSELCAHNELNSWSIHLADRGGDGLSVKENNPENLKITVKSRNSVSILDCSCLCSSVSEISDPASSWILYDEQNIGSGSAVLFHPGLASHELNDHFKAEVTVEGLIDSYGRNRKLQYTVGNAAS